MEEAQDLYLAKKTIALDTGASEEERAAAVDCLREFFSFSGAARAAELAEVAPILKHELLPPFGGEFRSTASSELPLAVLRLLAEILCRFEKSMAIISIGARREERGDRMTEANAEAWEEFLAIGCVTTDEFGAAVTTDEEWLNWAEWGLGSGSSLGGFGLSGVWAPADGAWLYAMKVRDELCSGLRSLRIHIRHSCYGCYGPPPMPADELASWQQTVVADELARRQRYDDEYAAAGFWIGDGASRRWVKLSASTCASDREYDLVPLYVHNGLIYHDRTVIHLGPMIPDREIIPQAAADTENFIPESGGATTAQPTTDPPGVATQPCVFLSPSSPAAASSPPATPKRPPKKIVRRTPHLQIDKKNAGGESDTIKRVVGNAVGIVCFAVVLSLLVGWCCQRCGGE